jgi:hypothetical protein
VRANALARVHQHVEFHIAVYLIFDRRISNALGSAVCVIWIGLRFYNRRLITSLFLLRLALRSGSSRHKLLNKSDSSVAAWRHDECDFDCMRPLGGADRTLAIVTRGIFVIFHSLALLVIIFIIKGLCVFINPGRSLYESYGFGSHTPELKQCNVISRQANPFAPGLANGDYPCYKKTSSV